MNIDMMVASIAAAGSVAAATITALVHRNVGSKNGQGSVASMAGETLVRLGRLEQKHDEHASNPKIHWQSCPHWDDCPPPAA